MGERYFGSKFVPKELYPLDGGVYAWGKTARLITEPAYLEARDQTEGDFIAVDLCSSFPYFREIMTGRHKELMHTETRRIVGRFIDDLHSSPRKNKFKSVVALYDNDKEALISLRKELAPKDNPARQLLTAPIFELMANPPPANKRDVETISSIILEKFKSSNIYYQFIYEPTGKPGDKGTWTFIAPVRNSVTLQEIIGSILEDRASEFIKDVSSYFGEQLVSENKLRRVTFLSLDFTPLDNLIKDAKNGFPERLQRTLFFRSVQNPQRHMCQDIRSLQFKKNGIGFFSSVEGWPYYGGSFGFDGNVTVAEKIASQLAPGGKAAFFPWNMQENHSFSQGLLGETEKIWLKLGLTMTKKDFTVDQILAGMTDRELVLANHSPILQQEGAIRSLTLSKPKS